KVGDHRQASRHDHVPVSRQLVDELAPENDPLRKTMLMALARRGDVSRRSAAQLLERAADPELDRLLGFYYDEVASIDVLDDQPTFDLSVPDNVTYVANGFVSHNTISFMMDCDTTGVEPDIALVKYKKLVGGGMLKMVNQTVPRALRRLGYDQKEIEEIVEYIDQEDTIEGAPHLKDEHLAVFDCAFKAAKGSRAISPSGHLRMMGAVQPFLSGAISKTINMPNDTTVEEVENAFLLAWKLGLKAVAIYRDGCKRTQPLNTSRGDAKAAPAAATAVAPVEAGRAEPAPAEFQPVRRRLPADCRSIRHKFDVAGHEGYIHVGFYDDGTPGEIFIKMAKEGSTISGLMDTIATLTSMSLQYGVPLDALVSKFSHVRFEPSGFTKNAEVPYAKSLTDYIFRFLGVRFLTPEKRTQVGLTADDAVEARPDVEALGSADAAAHAAGLPVAAVADGGRRTITFSPQADAPTCSDCGSIMIRNGSCYRCTNCGATSGCS
ncbi:MAG TPA: intein-containing adenosylcobalamin-dependent ribonucleoside-diphosphate reductase, partial [Candidatus Binatia bacterium]|nr:intein-containing adenosylcobalamin-dependent ribonucleoside-diphosphate reductase [Candidatus Binatia bacterium]